MKDGTWLLLLDWISSNGSLLIELLKAAIPVLALAVAAFAVYAVVELIKRGGRNE